MLIKKDKMNKNNTKKYGFIGFHRGTRQIKTLELDYSISLVHSDFHRKSCPCKYLKMFYTDFIYRQRKIFLAVKTEFSGLNPEGSATKYYYFTEKILDIIQFFKLEGQCVYCLLMHGLLNRWTDIFILPRPI